jgi:ketosteroid isomerase-like protein
MPSPCRLGVLPVVALSLLAACQAPTHISATDRRAIADSLSALVVEAYDFSQPGAAERLLSLYPDSGRVISAAAGQVTTTHDTLEGAIRGFWQRVGQNMQQPRFVLGSTYVDVLSRDAAVMTLTYSIPHRTPRDTPHVVSGAWTMLWRRQGGRWQIVQEHLSDTPESTAPGPPSAATDSTGGSDSDHQH